MLQKLNEEETSRGGAMQEENLKEILAATISQLNAVVGRLCALEGAILSTKKEKPQKEKKEPKYKRYSHVVMEIVQDGKVHSPYNISDQLLERGLCIKPLNVSQTLCRMVIEGKMDRVGMNLYRIKQ